MSKFAKGKFVMTCPEKYVGTKVPTYRSSWEWQFMKFCDTNPSVQKWASEAIQIPYKDPLTGRQTVYVPDFFIQYVDKTGATHVEIIEIKPAKETGGRQTRNRRDLLVSARNQAKWANAMAYCKHNGMEFRVLTEHDIFALSRAV